MAVSRSGNRIGGERAPGGSRQALAAGDWDVNTGVAGCHRTARGDTMRFVLVSPALGGAEAAERLDGGRQRSRPLTWIQAGCDGN